MGMGFITNNLITSEWDINWNMAIFTNYDQQKKFAMVRYQNTKRTSLYEIPFSRNGGGHRWMRGWDLTGSMLFWIGWGESSPKGFLGNPICDIFNFFPEDLFVW